MRGSLVMLRLGKTNLPSGPATVLRVMKVVNRSLRTKPIDLNRTYTTEFTSAVPR